jgi:hypothetical protein
MSDFSKNSCHSKESSDYVYYGYMMYYMCYMAMVSSVVIGLYSTSTTWFYIVKIL